MTKGFHQLTVASPAEDLAIASPVEVLVILGAASLVAEARDYLEGQNRLKNPDSVHESVGCIVFWRIRI
jgi:hypothetical protein